MPVNVCLIDGNAGSDAEMRYTPSGTASTTVNIAHSERYQKDGEWVENTHWVPISALGPVAERLAQVEKGDKILVQGEFIARQYKDKEGQQRTYYGIKARSFSFLSKKSDRQAQPPQQDEQDAYGDPPWD